MGYSTSVKTLENMLPQLKLLQVGKDCTWQTTPGKETKVLAYKLREALYIASNFAAEQYPQLAKASNEFELKVDAGAGKVYARRKKDGAEIKVGHTDGVEMSIEDTSSRSLNFAGPQTPAKIISEWINNDHPERMYFPDAALSGDDLLALHGWAEKRNLLLFVSGTAVTVQVMDPELAELAWRPEDLEGVL